MASPESVAEVEELVKSLYKPGAPTTINQISEKLQQLQLSQYGWKLADQLMASDDPNVRFFAALTFTVKLNNDGSSLDGEAAQTVLMRLMSWLVRIVAKGDIGLVSKKLCSSLTTYFLRSRSQWQRPLLHLAYSFHHGDAVTQSDLDESQATMSNLLPSLTMLQLQALLWFAGSLAEEVGRADVNAQANGRLHSEMESVVRDVSALINWSFAQSTVHVRADALRTFLAWVNYAQPVWPRNPEALQYLREMIAMAVHCLMDEELQQEALEVFRDILESYTSFFQLPHMDMLATIIYDYIRPSLLRALIDRDFDDGIAFGQLVIAYGCANIEQVVEQPNAVYGSEAIIKLHVDILRAGGYPGDDDELSIQSIEFWNTYIEYVNDVLFSSDQEEPDPVWLPQSKRVLSQVVEIVWRKMWTPPHEVGKGWGDAERAGFKEFRLDSNDLLLSVFVLLGKDMLRQLGTLALRSLEAKQWQAVEAALFCLNNLADNVLEDPSNEEVLGEIFRASNLFREIGDFSQNVPAQTRRTAIDMLGSYGQYIERHAEFLPDALRFLFASLETATLANAAAKSISALCSTCRATLTSELPGFLAQYQSFLASKTSDPYTKDKVIGAIAAIIQALSPESAKAKPLLALLQNIENDIAAAKAHAAAGESEMAELMGVTALECLASIGKGMQVPDDVPINLYDSDEKTPGPPSYWGSDEGVSVQKRIVGCFSVLQVVGTYSAAIDAACQVLRSGLTETSPGPFVLPTSVIVKFVQQCSITTPQLETVLSTACMLITQHSRANSKHIDEDVSAIHLSVTGFVQALGQAGNDPVVAMECISMMARLMPYYTHILLSHGIAFNLDFALSAIKGQDPFPKRSACEFWSKLLKPQPARISEETQQRINQVMAAYGPKFANLLVHQIGGEAQRSDLDFLCEPLKTLLLNQGSAQAWLQQSLSSDTFPSSKVTMNDRVMFLRQIVAARGDGNTIKRIVKDFWVACRGTVPTY